MALSKAKKIGILSLLVVILGTLTYFSFMYFGNYSVGKRTGTVMKLSKKGYVFKTWEGQLNQGLNNPPWQFSVDRGRKDVVTDLEKAAANNTHVTLHYEEKYVKYAWRGDTEYFIIKVEESKE